MVKFLLSLPLGIFIIAEAIVVYMLGDIIFKASTDSAAAVLIGKWNFYQIVLAMFAIVVGIILAAFFYSTVVLKPVFYPTPEDDKPRKQQRIVAAEQKKKSKKSLIILLILGVIVIGLVVTGVIFREEILGFIGSFTNQEDNTTDKDSENVEDNTDEALAETETEPATEPEPEPEIPALYQDLERNWTMYYPASLTISVEPIENELYREPSDIDTKLLYWSTANENGYVGAAAYAETDPAGVLSTAINSQVLNENVIVCRIDSADANGVPFSSVRFWYVDPNGIAAIDIPCETAEKADEWYASVTNGAISIEKMNAAEGTEENAGEPATG